MTIDLKKLFGTVENSDNKFHTALLKALKSNASPEFDYLKFKQSVSSLEEMDMDKTIAVRSAFATASTMGLTKSKLLTSAKQYKKVLNSEKSKFAEALQNQMTVRVAKKKEDAIKLKEKISEYERKIIKMKEEMELYKQKIGNVDGEIQEAKSKIENTKNEFLTAYDSVTEIIEEDMSLITGNL